jgi:hypothetical protein
MAGRLITATVLALAVPLTIAGYVQATADNGISTRFKGEQSTLGPGHVRLHGRLQAGKHKCKTGRRVDLYFNRAEKRHQLDTASSSLSGAVALKGRWHKTPFPRRLVVIVRRKHVINAFNRYTCLRTRWVWQITRHRGVAALPE